ncbi:MAG: hypothetical protein ACC656_07290 [Candidatus Heimdallarchaeota archaeon]
MRKSIFYFILVLLGFMSNSVNAFLTCQMVQTPTLSIYVYDSLTNEPIETAKIKTYFISNEWYGSDTPRKLHAAKYNYSGQFYNADISFINGEDLQVVIKDPNYNTFDSGTLRFKYGNGCNAASDWTLKVYMCPKNKSCWSYQVPLN